MARLRYNGLKASLGAALAAAGASYSATILADSPVAWYRMGDTSGSTMADSSGNGHNGSYNGGTLNSAGLLVADANKAVAFTTAQWAQVNTINTWFPSASSFSVEAWIKPTSVGGVQTICAPADSSGYPWIFQLNGSALRLINVGGGDVSSASGVVAAGATHHVVATMSGGGTVKLYVNGTLVATATGRTAGFGLGANFYIGRDYIGSGFSAENNFAGTVDEVALYSGDLTPTRVANHYTAGTAAAPTTITLAAALTHSNGTAVPTIVTPDYLPLTLLDSFGNLSELVYLTSYTAGATTGTVLRAQEGTPLADHASGDKVVHGPTIQEFPAYVRAISSAGPVQLTSATYVPLDTASDVAIAATVGDLLIVELAGSASAPTTGSLTVYGYVNLAASVRVGGSEVRSVSFPDNIIPVSANNFAYQGLVSAAWIVVTSGDIDTDGKVHLRAMANCSDGARGMGLSELRVRNAR